MSPTASNHDRNPPKPSHPKKKRKKKSSATDDDTPKAFARLMQYKATGKIPNGLDDPKSKSKSQSQSQSQSQPNSRKRKRTAATNDNGTAATESSTAAAADTDDAPKPQPPPSLTSLKPLPGEKLSDFSRRVDQAIPISLKGLKSGEDSSSSKKKQKKRYHPNPLTEDELIEASYDFDDNGDLLPQHKRFHQHLSRGQKKDLMGVEGSVASEILNKGKEGKGRKRSPSPFAELRNRRPVQMGINDVVQAPPTFGVVPKEKLRDKTAAGSLGVPKASGSLARREMLEAERVGIVERYRALMAAKSGGQ